MMTDDASLLAYVDGDLPPDECVAIEKRIRLSSETAEKIALLRASRLMPLVAAVGLSYREDPNMLDVPIGAVTSGMSSTRQRWPDVAHRCLVARTLHALRPEDQELKARDELTLSSAATFTASTSHFVVSIGCGDKRKTW